MQSLAISISISAGRRLFHIDWLPVKKTLRKCIASSCVGFSCGRLTDDAALASDSTEVFLDLHDLLSLRGLFSQILSRTNQLVPLEEKIKEREWESERKERGWGIRNNYPFRGGGRSGGFHVVAVLGEKKKANNIGMSVGDLSHPRLLLLLLLTHCANLAAVEL